MTPRTPIDDENDGPPEQPPPEVTGVSQEEPFVLDDLLPPDEGDTD